jgi:hypothetical protein
LASGAVQAMREVMDADAEMLGIETLGRDGYWIDWSTTEDEEESGDDDNTHAEAESGTSDADADDSEGGDELGDAR